MKANGTLQTAWSESGQDSATMVQVTELHYNLPRFEFQVIETINALVVPSLDPDWTDWRGIIYSLPLLVHVVQFHVL